MFEEQRLFGETEQSIRLDTRRGSPIENARPLEPSGSEDYKFQIFWQEHRGHTWKIRSLPDIHYNCAGHVWASRRTCIYETAEWRKILEQDGYRKTNQPVSDDLVLYWLEDNSLAHVARVCRLVDSGLSRPTPHVISKWGDTGGEVFHLVSEVPSAIRGRYEFWTDRQRDATGLPQSPVT